MPFRDKTVTTILVVALLLALALGWMVFQEPEESGGPATLTEADKNATLTIALADPIVLQTIDDTRRTFAVEDRGRINDSLIPPYVVRWIGTAPVREVAPGVDRVRELPCVEILIGNEGDGIAIMDVFVDSAAGRVAAIGFTGRNGGEASYHLVQQSDNGIIVSFRKTSPGISDYFVSAGTLFNCTLVGKGNYERLTTAEKDRLANVARGNSTVQDYIASARARNETIDYNYYTGQHWGMIDGHPYISRYPVVGVLSKWPNGSYNTTLTVEVDIPAKSVVSTQESPVYRGLDTPPHPW